MNISAKNEAFVRLYAREEGRLRRYVSALVPIPTDMDDVLQETAIAAEYQAPRASFASDRSLRTGVINLGGSRSPLSSDPVLTVADVYLHKFEQVPRLLSSQPVPYVGRLSIFDPLGHSVPPNTLSRLPQR